MVNPIDLKNKEGKVNSYTAKYGSTPLSSASGHKIHPARKSRKEG
jgi:hypothetical protein